MIRWQKREKRDWQEGDIRVVRRFLLFPKCLPTHDGVEEWRWLGRCLIKQRLVAIRTMTAKTFPYNICAWELVEWVDG